MQTSFLHEIIRPMVPKAFSDMFRTYRYRVEVSDTRNIKEKFSVFFQTFWRFFIHRNTILFYPDEPLPFHALYKILMFLGYRISSNTQNNCDLGIKWWLAFDGNPFGPSREDMLSKITHISPSTKLLNIDCHDISKEKVNAVFKETFGYSLSVDPRIYNGKCVMKSNWNALHQGRVINCPVKNINENVVYQKLIRNEVEDGLVEDMRVPIFSTKIPFVYLKYRSVKDRFVDRKHTGKKAIIVELNEVLVEKELNCIFHFCERIGLDYGELDVLRDRGDGRIYIVDVNNTPSGPTSAISDDDRKVAVVRLAQAFEAAFGK